MLAPDRIEWDAGGLYDGRFADGTPFQIQLAYPRPTSVSDHTAEVWNAYWYPRHFNGERIVLSALDAPAGTIKLVQLKPIANAVETFTIALAPDRLSGSGNWTSSTLGTQRSITLHRAFLYREVAVTRPATSTQPAGSRPFRFSALFPVLSDAVANDWMRTGLRACTDLTECANSVMVDWHSPALVSLDATTYGYTAPGAHGTSTSTMRHFELRDGKMSPLGLDRFLDLGPSCRRKVSVAIASKLQVRNLSKYQEGALHELGDAKFLALPDGIEFHFDPYDVGSYVEGSPSVFVTRSELGRCVRNLPRID